MNQPKPSETVRKWQDTPSSNTRYKGATPADVGLALLRKSANRQQARDRRGDGN